MNDKPTIPPEIIERAARAMQKLIEQKPFFNLSEGLSPVLAGSLGDARKYLAEAALTAAGHQELREALEAILERGVDAGGMEIARAALAIGRGEKK